MQSATIIKLSGPLIREFGREHHRHLDSGSVTEAFRALCVTLPGFAEAIARLERQGLRFAIFRNRRNVSEAEFGIAGTEEVRVVPVLSGSKRAGLLQTVIGVAMIVVGAMTSWAGGAMLMQAGIAVAMGGAAQMLSPQAKGLKQSAAPENQPSHGFGSAKNTTASGNPVPICAGRRRWGGAVISASIYAEDKS